jgi:hypothetical protein
VRKRPNHQKKVPLKNRGVGEEKAEDLSHGVKRPGTRCASNELLIKPFSDYLHLHLHSQKQHRKKNIYKWHIKRCGRRRVCVMDSSYSHMSLSDKLDGRTDKNSKPPPTFYNYFLLLRSRIQLPLLTFGSRRTGRKTQLTKSINHCFSGGRTDEN